MDELTTRGMEDDKNGLSALDAPADDEEKKADEFYDGLVQQFPDAQAQADCAAARHKGLFMRTMAAALLILGIIAAVCLVFPKRHPASQLPFCTLPQKLLSDPVLGKAAGEAFECFRNGRYDDCCMILKPIMLQPAGESPGENIRNVCFLFFDSVLRSKDKALAELAMAKTDELLSDKPDLDLMLVQVMLRYRDVLDYQGIYEQLGTEGLLSERHKLIEMSDEAILSCRLLCSIRVDGTAEDQAQQRRLKISSVLASVYTSKWLLEGGKGRRELPAGQHSPGVEYREAALDIASGRIGISNDGDLSCEDFLRIRLFIATTLKEQKKGSTDSYYWNGEKYYSTLPLKREINIVSRKLHH